MRSFGIIMTGVFDSTFIHPRDRVDVFGAARSDRVYPALKDVFSSTEIAFKQLNICIITQDFVGPVKNGGIGTAYTYAAKALAQAGHSVTVLYSIKNCVDKNLAYWQSFYAEIGIKFVPIVEPEVPIVRGPTSGGIRIAYQVYEWLKKRSDEFDFVHASEWSANAYFCLQAKHSGLYFQNTQFVIKCSSPTLWNRIGNAEPISDVRSLSLMYVERRSVELADYVICGSQYLLNWMEDQNYSIPYKKTYVQPNIFPVDDVDRSKVTDVPVEVKELVFFGRLEPRKGLHFFVDALIQLKTKGFFDQRAIPCISLLGKPREGFNLKAQINKLEKQLGIKVNLLDDKNQPKALEYLSSGSGRVAVMPSLMDNSPFGVYECLAKGIAFITSTAGGGKELISKEGSLNVLFDPTPASLASRFEAILDKGCPIVSPSFEFSDNIDDWMRWHLYVDASLEKNHPSCKNEEVMPLVSVCMAHHNRGPMLLNAI